jgi:hypothetical protein
MQLKKRLDFKDLSEKNKNNQTPVNHVFYDENSISGKTLKYSEDKENKGNMGNKENKENKGNIKA